ncbi:MAG: hypothetical protein EP297_11335 [Gammaproteobacteria bacterium]|nr:MAG: hypothetical protein EP297_11335 [Gammaproteobacteria bacterium]
MTSENEELIRLLEEIRDNQKLQIEHQSEALSIQKEQFELVRQRYEKAAKLQERAEVLQDKSSALMEKGRKVFLIIIPILIVLIGYVTWLLLR